MKKIFSIFASSVLALSMFVSCSGDLHNDMDPAKVALIMGETKTILDEADILGTINDWTGSALTKVDATTYTYTFTADTEDEQFSIREVAGSWTAGNRWCGALKQDEDNAVKIEPKGEAAMVYSTDPNPSHFKLTKLEVGKAYKITITIVDEDKKSLKASVNVDGDAPAADTPAPFYLDAMFVIGDMNDWKVEYNNLLKAPVLDKKTGELTYAYDFKATEDSHSFGIASGEGSWKTKYTGANFAYGSDTDFVETTLGAKDNNSISGLTIGTSYRITVFVTPDKKVSYKVSEICEYKLQLKITGFDGVDGQTALVHGTFDNWAGWSKYWNGDKKISETVTKAEIADNTAVIDIYSGRAAPNEEISFEVSGYYGVVEDDYITKETVSGEIKNGKNNFNITGKITKAGNYVVTLDLSEGEISEAKFTE